MLRKRRWSGDRCDPVETLSDVIEFLHGRKRIEPVQVDREELFGKFLDYPFDFNEIHGQDQAKEPWKSQRQEGIMSS